MSSPPVTYSCSLHDLTLFADAACYLDSYKDTCSADSVERANVLALLCRVHEAVERISGDDSHLIYAEDHEALKKDHRALCAHADRAAAQSDAEGVQG